MKPDTFLSRLDLHEFLSKVLAGLADDSDEIKVSHMMLSRFSQVASTAVVQRLDEVTPLLEKSMKGAAITKDTIKQDIEHAAELQRSTRRAVIALSEIVTPGPVPKFEAFMEATKRNPDLSRDFEG